MTSQAPTAMSRRSQNCPGTRITCPACGHPVLHTELPDGDAFFCCQRKNGGTHCYQNFYVACSEYYCVSVAVTREEREQLRFLPGKSARLEYLGMRVANDPPTPVAEAA